MAFLRLGGRKNQPLAIGTPSELVLQHILDKVKMGAEEQKVQHKLWFRVSIQYDVNERQSDDQ
jgi:hypothetical protein